MCNVITYWFSCQHSYVRRRSHCQGTKHRVSVRGIRATCSAKSFLALVLDIPCGACRQEEWEEQWQHKLERAKSFLQSLEQRFSPATEEVIRLVEQLECEYATAAWSSRNVFGPGHESSVVRVEHTFHKEAPSPLRQEVRPEDVPDISPIKTWADMNEADYEGECVASTDPMHPVSVDYSHPEDDDDVSWISENFPDGTHFLDDNMDYNDGENTLDDDHSGDANLDQLDPYTEETYSTVSPDGLTSPPLPSNTLESVDQTIAAFWNHITNYPPKASPPLSPNITGKQVPTTTKPHFLDRQSPNSTCAYFDKFRRKMFSHKHEDVDKYYSDWLKLSRSEIRTIEGPNGKRIDDPLMEWLMSM